MVIFACILKSGGDYTPDDVLRLQKQVKKWLDFPHRFVCYSDMAFEDCEIISLEKGYPGWWSVPEVYRTTGPTIVTGLDTVILGDITPLAELANVLFEDEFYLLKAFHPRRAAQGVLINGIMVWNGDFSWLWENFDYAKHSKLYRGDMEYSIPQLTNNEDVNLFALQDAMPGIYSYKFDCLPFNKVPDDAKIIVFHGNPRPQEVTEPWMKERINE